DSRREAQLGDHHGRLRLVEAFREAHRARAVVERDVSRRAAEADGNARARGIARRHGDAHVAYLGQVVLATEAQPGHVTPEHEPAGAQPDHLTADRVPETGVDDRARTQDGRHQPQLEESRFAAAGAPGGDLALY